MTDINEVGFTAFVIFNQVRGSVESRPGPDRWSFWEAASTCAHIPSPTRMWEDWRETLKLYRYCVLERR